MGMYLYGRLRVTYDSGTFSLLQIIGEQSEIPMSGEGSIFWRCWLGFPQTLNNTSQCPPPLLLQIGTWQWCSIFKTIQVHAMRKKIKWLLTSKRHLSRLDFIEHEGAEHATARYTNHQPFPAVNPACFNKNWTGKIKPGLQKHQYY